MPMCTYIHNSEKNKQTNNKNKREKNSGVIQGPQHLTNRMRKETFTEIRKVLPKIKDTSPFQTSNIS